MIEHRREISGISGWNLIAPLVAQMPEDMLETCQKCESPIEQLFASALCLIILTKAPSRRPKLDTQVSIGRDRADIVLTGPLGAPRIVVECDGAEFHKNVGKDAKRTAEIEQKGYRVVRVTGSEIHHNPLARAKNLLAEIGLLS
jgi:very-short-patch-repair endonuclease